MTTNGLHPYPATLSATIKRRAALAMSCGTLALLSSGAAFAQTSGPTDDSSVLPEVVVTATRQAVSVNRVAQSISAVTQEAADARGVKQIADLARLTPGLQFDPVGFGALNNIAIRGISSGTGAATTGIYLDETPIQVRQVGYSSTNAYPQIFDLERVEVLRGPQGTLFGAGSEGGTVRFITPSPSLTDYSAYGRAELSKTKGGGTGGEFGLGVGGPIVEDKVGFRISAWHREDAGYVDRVAQDPASTLAGRHENTNSGDVSVVRAAVTVAPTENVKITPSLFYQHQKIDDTSQYWINASNPGQNSFVNGQPLAQPYASTFYLPALNIQANFGGVELVSNTSLFQSRDHSTIDYSTYLPSVFGLPQFLIPNFQAPTYMENRQQVFVQEARLQSTDTEAKLHWVVGAFYSNSRQRFYEHVDSPSFDAIAPTLTGGFLNTAQLFGLPLVDGRYALVGTAQGVDSQLAGFGQVDYAFTEKLKVTAGLRVAESKFEGSSIYTGPFVGTTAVQAPGKTTEHPVTPKLGVTYQATSNDMFYATVAKGYRVGGVNAPVGGPCAGSLAAIGMTQVPSSYASDSLWSYEVGSKSRLFENRLQLNASAFHIDWSNIQQLVILSCGATFNANLGKATSNGFDLQMAYRVAPGLTIDASTGYTDAHITKSVPGAPGANIISKGDHLETHPWNVALGLAYEHTLVDEYVGYFRADYQYNSGGEKTAVTDPTTASYDSHVPQSPQTHYATLRAGVRARGLDLSLFVDNLTDAHPALVTSDEVRNGPLLGDSLRAQTYRPRTVGITAIFRR